MSSLGRFLDRAEIEEIHFDDDDGVHSHALKGGMKLGAGSSGITFLKLKEIFKCINHELFLFNFIL